MKDGKKKQIICNKKVCNSILLFSSHALNSFVRQKNIFPFLLLLFRICIFSEYSSDQVWNSCRVLFGVFSKHRKETRIFR